MTTPAATETKLDDLVAPRERALGTVTLVIGIVGWLVLIGGTFGAALIVLGLGYLVYLFVQSALIAHVHGNGVALSAAQFPDLYADFWACCQRLEIVELPDAYLLAGDGRLNAFATRFLGVQYVVLLSDLVDAMAGHPDGVRFYLGHELGHLRRRHLLGQLLRWPALWLPLLGAAYSRARETTCDRHGAACCSSRENAARALAALAAGSQRWRQLDLNAYVEQTRQPPGFWMSFHGLTSAYPWLSQRVARTLDPSTQAPSRSAAAYALAAVVPYAGRLGGGFGLLILLYGIGVAAAVAIPAYQDQQARELLGQLVIESERVRDALAEYYQKNDDVPESLDAAGLPSQLPSGHELSLDPDQMVLTVITPHGELMFSPSIGANDRVVWTCSGGEGLRDRQLPLVCRSGEPLGRLQ
jgi:Zn-dependent protease with chaperone function/type II secretory pathway pseudopilin PulG